jgi:hypothetical protein
VASSASVYVATGVRSTLPATAVSYGLRRLLTSAVGVGCCISGGEVADGAARLPLMAPADVSAAVAPPTVDGSGQNQDEGNDNCSGKPQQLGHRHPPLVPRRAVNHVHSKDAGSRRETPRQYRVQRLALYAPADKLCLG